ncbi:hypothetical protein AA313_de0205106 [Arthrobotrys entomopaga]|nr:hypothetical protein AA313_de0205106 [Arthrobotrys entomopaga]
MPHLFLRDVASTLSNPEVETEIHNDAAAIQYLTPSNINSTATPYHSELPLVGRMLMSFTIAFFLVGTFVMWLAYGKDLSKRAIIVRIVRKVFKRK